MAAVRGGGAAEELEPLSVRLNLTARAPGSAHVQRGGSPLPAGALRPVTECYCDAAMRGGEPQEVNDQSVG